MLSTCPECQTSFRISQAQLDARRGLVRCGRCSAVFNAYDTLLPELQTPPADLPQQGLASTLPLTAETAAAPLPEVRAEVRSGLEGPELSGPATAPEPLPVPFHEAQDSPGPQEAAQDILLTELFRREERPAPGKAWLWGGLALLLFLLLGLQLGYFLRGELAARLPASRPWLTQVCAALGCTVPLPQDAAALRIESSSLETDPENRSRAILRLSLSNRSDQAVAWPHLVLLLSDVNDTPLAERPFMPVEYLLPGSDAGLGIQSGQEQEISLELEIRGLSAYGYKVEKRYP